LPFYSVILTLYIAQRTLETSDLI